MKEVRSWPPPGAPTCPTAPRRSPTGPSPGSAETAPKASTRPPASLLEARQLRRARRDGPATRRTVFPRTLPPRSQPSDFERSISGALLSVQERRKEIMTRIRWFNSLTWLKLVLPLVTVLASFTLVKNARADQLSDDLSGLASADSSE